MYIPYRVQRGEAHFPIFDLRYNIPADISMDIRREPHWLCTGPIWKCRSYAGSMWACLKESSQIRPCRYSPNIYPDMVLRFCIPSTKERPSLQLSSDPLLLFLPRWIYTSFAKVLDMIYFSCKVVWWVSGPMDQDSLNCCTSMPQAQPDSEAIAIKVASVGGAS